MNCTSCKSSTFCGCASDCKPYDVCPNFLKCPRPPQIPSCGERTCSDGTKEPVWNPVHPLIPMFLECYSRSIDTSCGDNDDYYRSHWQDIKCLFFDAARLYSTCKYPGMSYYEVMCLYVAARFEYRRKLRQWEAIDLGLASQGKTNNRPMPTLYDGEYGQLLKRMEKSRKTGIVLIGG
jgi:hypothetical protein